MIEVTNLSKSYSTGSNIIRSVSLQLAENRIHFLMGKNGSGKTTFIKCLLGLEEYDGTVTFGGHPLQRVRDRLFAIYDDIPLYDNLNGFQNIRLMLEDSGIYDEESITGLHLLTSRKLSERVKGYSLGEKKKLALIAAILRKPKYLFIDEISNGLDIETLETLRLELDDLRNNSLVFATGHHFEFYQEIADELLILHDNTITHVSEYAKGGGNLHGIYKKYISRY